jgi:hypothetical protein
VTKLRAGKLGFQIPAEGEKFVSSPKYHDRLWSYELESWGFESRQRARNLSLLQNIITGSGNHPASHKYVELYRYSLYTPSCYGQ